MSLRKNRKKILLMFVFSMAILTLGVTQVRCAVTISPTTASALLNMPVTYTVTGLNESRTYSVEVDDSEIVTGYSPSTGGGMTFSVSVTTAGSHKVEVVDDTDDSVVASANIIGQDIMPVLIGAMTLLITVSIVFAVYKAIEDIM